MIGTAILMPLIVSAIAHGGQAQSGQDSAKSQRGADQITVVRSESRPPYGGSDLNFTGSVRIEPLFAPVAPTRSGGSRVTFQPGARTVWHTHPLGQILIVTDGTGWVQQWGGPVQEMRQGDVVRIPPGMKHWHGATPASPMTHIAIQEQLDGKVVEWMEKVSDRQYRQQ